MARLRRGGLCVCAAVASRRFPAAASQWRACKVYTKAQAKQCPARSSAKCGSIVIRWVLRGCCAETKCAAQKVATQCDDGEGQVQKHRKSVTRWDREHSTVSTRSRLRGRGWQSFRTAPNPGNRLFIIMAGPLEMKSFEPPRTSAIPGGWKRDGKFGKTS